MTNSDHDCRDCAGRNGSLRRRIMTYLYYHGPASFPVLREKAGSVEESDDSIHAELTLLLAAGLVLIQGSGQYRRTDR